MILYGFFGAGERGTATNGRRVSTFLHYSQECKGLRGLPETGGCKSCLGHTRICTNSTFHIFSITNIIPRKSALLVKLTADKFPVFYENAKIHYSFQNRLPLEAIVSHINPVHILTAYLLASHLNIIIVPMPRLLKSTL